VTRDPETRFHLWWAVSRLKKWKQMMSIHVIKESDINNFLDNV